MSLLSSCTFHNRLIRKRNRFAGTVPQCAMNSISCSCFKWHTPAQIIISQVWSWIGPDLALNWVVMYSGSAVHMRRSSLLKVTGLLHFVSECITLAWHAAALSLASRPQGEYYSVILMGRGSHSFN